MKQKLALFLFAVLLSTAIIAGGVGSQGNSSGSEKHTPYYRPLFPVKKPADYGTSYQTYTGWMPRIGLIVAAPRSDFKATSGSYAGGFTLGFSYQPWQKAPVSFGFDGGLMWYGYNLKDISPVIEITSGGVVVDRIVLEMEMQLQNRMWPMLGHMEVWAPTPVVQPFVGAYGGMNMLTTVTRIMDRTGNNIFSDEDSDLILRKTNKLSATWAAGIGGGLRVDLTHSAMLDLMAVYMWGGKAKYYDADDTESWDIRYAGTLSNYNPADLSKDDLQIGIDPKQSTTDMLFFQLKLVVRI